MESLRDIGYEPPCAVADLVDNSIDADARSIDITFAPAGRASLDPGRRRRLGMTRAPLDEAMRYGSRRDYGRRPRRLRPRAEDRLPQPVPTLTVASRTTERGTVEIRRWDLDRVARQRCLGARAPSLASARDTYAPLRGHAGTVVLWERLDRVLDYARPDGAAARRALSDLAGGQSAAPRDGLSPLPLRRVRRGRARTPHLLQRRAAGPGIRSPGSEPRTQAPRAAMANMSTLAERSTASGSALHPAQPDSVLDPRGPCRRGRSEAMESPAGSLHLPTRSPDPERRLESPADTSMSTASSRGSRWTSRPAADARRFRTNVSKMGSSLPHGASPGPAPPSVRGREPRPGGLPPAGERSRPEGARSSMGNGVCWFKRPGASAIHWSH